MWLNEHYPEWNRLDTKGHILHCFHVYDILPNENESIHRPIVARDWGVGIGLCTGAQGDSWDEETILYLECSSPDTCVYFC